MLTPTARRRTDMMTDATAAQKQGYDECKGLIALILKLDWKALEAAAKKYVSSGFQSASVT